MFSLDNVVLPNALEGRLGFLTDLGISFGGFIKNIGGGHSTPIWILFGFILALLFKNSIQKIDDFQPNYKTAIFVAFILYSSLVSMISKKSEFLYFNF